MVTVLLAVLAALSNAVASVLQRLANRQEVGTGSGGLRGLVNLLRRRSWLLGFGAVLVSFGLQAGALSGGQVAAVQTLLLLELPVALVLGSRVFHRPLTRREWPAIAAMTVGVATLLICLSPRGGEPRQVDGFAWTLSGVAVGALLLVLLVLALRAERVLRAALLGAASGVTFAVTAVLMTAALADGWSRLLLTWQTYVMALAGLAALVLLQEALRSGRLLAVQPGVTLSDPSVAIIFGVLLFGETVRRGPWLAGDAAGAMLVAWGTWRLCHSPLLEDERGGEPVGEGVPAPSAPR